MWARWILPGLLLVACTPSGDLTIDDAWVRPLVPGMGMTAAYAQLKNTSGRPIEFCELVSPQFESVELHRTEIVAGVAKMRQMNELSLAPEETLTLEPGGLHLMLIGPLVRDLQHVEFEVTACDGHTWRVSAPVERR